MNKETESLLNRTYDVIIVGGGPAGTVAAQYSAKGGARTILFERDPVIGVPVRCGEGISKRGLMGYLSLNGPWIANKLNQVELISPDNTKVLLKTDLIGYILDRTKFDKALGDKAEKAGVSIITEADVVGLITEGDFASGIQVLYKKRRFEVYGKIIIGADGVESKVGRWAGMKTMTKFNNMESALQVNAANIDVNPRTCQFYFGEEVAPGGYLWVFPKDEHHANIGLGISGNCSRNKPAQDYLEKFMNKNFPHAEWTNVVAGGIPCNLPLKELTKKNVMVAGDAGHQVNPMTGAGIANALQAGKLAGETAAEALHTNGSLEKSLRNYTVKWYRARGRYHKSASRLKNKIMKFKDDDFDKLARLIHGVPKSEWSILKIFLLAVRNYPELIIDSIRLFGKLK